MVIKIRKLSFEDIEAVIKVARESWKWTYEGIYSEEYIENWIKEKYSNENLANEIARAESNLDILFLGAFADSILTGFIELKLSGNNAELLRLYLKPELTHRQIGKLLLLEAEKIMRERDILQCRLYVHKQNSVGFSFYIKNGFTVTEIDGNDFIMEKSYQLF